MKITRSVAALLGGVIALVGLAHVSGGSYGTAAARTAQPTNTSPLVTPPRDDRDGWRLRMLYTACAMLRGPNIRCDNPKIQDYEVNLWENRTVVVVFEDTKSHLLDGGIRIVVPHGRNISVVRAATTPRPVEGLPLPGGPYVFYSGLWLQVVLDACDMLAAHYTIRCDDPKIDKYLVDVRGKGTGYDVNFFDPSGYGPQSDIHIDVDEARVFPGGIPPA